MTSLPGMWIDASSDGSEHTALSQNRTRNLFLLGKLPLPKCSEIPPNPKGKAPYPKNRGGFFFGGQHSPQLRLFSAPLPTAGHRLAEAGDDPVPLCRRGFRQGLAWRARQRARQRAFRRRPQIGLADVSGHSRGTCRSST